MTPRDRRLRSDLRDMAELANAGVLVFRADGDPATRYHVLFELPGLALDRERRLVVRSTHRCEVYLHRDYPRRPPVVTWETSIFHPNITPPERNGGVCIGGWSAAERLTDLCLRLRDMISYGSFNMEDALDPEAAAWVRRHGISAGADVGRLAELPVAPEPDLLVARSR